QPCTQLLPPAQLHSATSQMDAVPFPAQSASVLHGEVGWWQTPQPGDWPGPRQSAPTLEQSASERQSLPTPPTMLLAPAPPLARPPAPPAPAPRPEPARPASRPASPAASVNL